MGLLEEDVDREKRYLSPFRAAVAAGTVALGFFLGGSQVNAEEERLSIKEQKLGGETNIVVKYRGEWEYLANWSIVDEWKDRGGVTVYRTFKTNHGDIILNKQMNNSITASIFRGEAVIQFEGKTKKLRSDGYFTELDNVEVKNGPRGVRNTYVPKRENTPEKKEEPAYRPAERTEERTVIARKENNLEGVVGKEICSKTFDLDFTTSGKDKLEFSIDEENKLEIYGSGGGAFDICIYKNRARILMNLIFAHDTPIEENEEFKEYCHKVNHPFWDIKGTEKGKIKLLNIERGNDEKYGISNKNPNSINLDLGDKEIIINIENYNVRRTNALTYGGKKVSDLEIYKVKGSIRMIDKKAETGNTDRTNAANSAENRALEDLLTKGLKEFFSDADDFGLKEFYGCCVLSKTGKNKEWLKKAFDKNVKEGKDIKDKEDIEKILNE